MNCAQVRKLLAEEGSDVPGVEIRDHLDECPGCARFAERLKLAAEILRNHQSGTEPDAGFATRVVAALPTSSADLLGWAAMRLLPATLALALVLTVWALAATPSPTSLVEQALGDDLWSWILDSPGGES
ncbi:MAG: hypothetical protein EP299_00460 [Acidobacteria bacterium]|nr:MAG: hypothetical protein EP299_00460 [Acidobacteriota bacterium]